MRMQCSTMIAVLLIGVFGSVSAVTRPNIILMVADDLGWDDVGFHGSEIKTPNIDKLAYDGVILKNYYVSPICTPTRGCLMTGKHPIHIGLQHYVIAAPEPWGLPLNHTTMAQHMKNLGYATHIVGKWHLGFFKSEYLPTSRGFDSHVGYWTGKEDYYSHEDDDVYSGLDFRRNMQVVNETFYSTEQYTKEALNIIDAHNKSEPLFLYMAYQAVHAGNGYTPLQAPDVYVDRFPYILDKRRRTFAGMVAALDDSVGGVIRRLNHHNLMANTVIVFTTDNGGPAHYYDGNAACNVPLRGVKNTLWEGGVHGVGFVHSRLLNKTHVKTDNLMHVSDWLPTLYSAAGGDVTDLGEIDGIDMWDTLKNNGAPKRTEVLHNIDPKSNFSAIRVGDYKLVQGDISDGKYNWWYPCGLFGDDDDDNSALDAGSPEDIDQTLYFRREHAEQRSNRTRRSTSGDLDMWPPNTPYVIDCGKIPDNYTNNCFPTKAPCLFHIPTDPCEYWNIADTNEGIVKNLLSRINEYSKTAVEPVNKPVDKNANPKFYNGVWVPWQDQEYLL